jgi:tRNA(fMet)-specific endonuclease VapC
VRRICLDTSAYSHFKRGDPEAVDEIAAARGVGVPAVVLGELRAGFRLGRQADRNEDELREFLSNPVVHVLDVDDEAASFYADLVVDLRRGGTPVPTNDIWIAALAVREGATVLTYDRHFADIRRTSAKILDHAAP